MREGKKISRTIYWELYCIKSVTGCVIFAIKNFATWRKQVILIQTVYFLFNSPLLFPLYSSAVIARGKTCCKTMFVLSPTFSDPAIATVRRRGIFLRRNAMTSPVIVSKENSQIFRPQGESLDLYVNKKSIRYSQYPIQPRSTQRSQGNSRDLKLTNKVPTGLQFSKMNSQITNVLLAILAFAAFVTAQQRKFYCFLSYLLLNLFMILST